MQVRLFQNHYSSSKALHKATSLPSFTETAYSSSNSIESSDEQYRKAAVKWILSYNKRVTKGTQYLAIAYLTRLSTKGIMITEENHEQIAITALLIASKMNEIYPPKITSMIARCRKSMTRDDIISFEAKIVGAFNYDIALAATPYSLISSILGCLYADRLQQCEKLLRIVASQKEVYEFGDEILAYAVVYLIVPQFVKQMGLREGPKIKTLAISIYNLYQQAKLKYQKEKENLSSN